ncbi:hypothetical protein ACFLTE_06610 [Bacteroidota bacterium]
MKGIYFRNICICLMFYIVFFWCLGCSDKISGTQNHTKIKDSKLIQQGLDNQEIAVQPPPFSEDIFPCSMCHDEMEPDPERRILWMHEEIDAEFSHDEENRWCLDCHDIYNRDSLRLASGKLLDFQESFKLCGQCHGDKLRHWRAGEHGKRTGYWNGKKEYLLCVHCHDPHAPTFKKVVPEPPPASQDSL